MAFMRRFNMNLNEHRILITGATSGIGREIAMRLSHAGTTIALTGRTGEKLEKLVSELPNPPAFSMAGDLTSASFVNQFVSAADEKMGGFTAVVHAAGVGLIKPVLETPDADFLRVTNLNLRGTFLIAQQTCKVMVRDKKGLFITFPGILGKAVMKNTAAYAASKWGVTGLIKSMAIELQRSGVNFSLFHLGGVDSPFWDEMDMKVDRSKMIPVATAADLVINTLAAPAHLVMNEITLQPESHQM